jgi:methyl-accepting chemotaxis protein
VAANNDNLETEYPKRKKFVITRQFMVFPAMTAFFILAGFGFHLMYTMVGDVHRMADSVGINMSAMAGTMQRVSSNLDELTGSVHSIAVNLDDLTVRIHDMGDTMEVISGSVEPLQPMLSNLDAMNISMGLIDSHMGSMNENIEIMNGQVGTMTNYMGSITTSTHLINLNITDMNQHIGRPLNFMNNFAPW